MENDRHVAEIVAMDKQSPARPRSEGGFTLVELLVVIVIIAILAAIAIPFFISMRERGWKAQSESALKNAATAMDSRASKQNGQYELITEFDLEDEGLRYAETVDLAIESAANGSFCLSAEHTLWDVTLYWDSNVGRPMETAC